MWEEGEEVGRRVMRTHRGTGDTGGIWSTRAKMMKSVPMMNSMTRKKRIRKGRNAFLGMHFAMTATELLPRFLTER